MADSVSLHSRVVFLLKIVLPLAALAILSTLFLLARGQVQDGTSPISGVDLNDLATRPRLTNPEYSGVTSDGASVTVRAAEARPASNNAAGQAIATTISATYDRDDGFRLTVTSDTGALLSDTGLLSLTGNVVAVTSSGYTLRSAALDAELKRTRLKSAVPVDVTAPFGTLTAGSMEVSGGEGPQGHDVMVFNKGVRLIYDPTKSSGTNP